MQATTPTKSTATLNKRENETKFAVDDPLLISKKEINVNKYTTTPSIQNIIENELEANINPLRLLGNTDNNVSKNANTCAMNAKIIINTTITAPQPICKLSPAFPPSAFITLSFIVFVHNNTKVKINDTSIKADETKLKILD